MAKCDKGYHCKVCGSAVDVITDSDLYLRYLLHEIQAEVLHLEPECHIRCNPERAQYIMDPSFDDLNAGKVLGPFAKNFLDDGYVAEEEIRVTAAWLKLRKLADSGVAILDYPQT
jgi:hypothetical protein